MKKETLLKVILSILCIAAVLLVVIFKSDGIKFKMEYENYNGKTTASGKEYRTITIDYNNPYVYTTLEDINKKIENKETFIVYFGAWWCPWCRSMLPTSITKAKEHNIDKIYYVNVRNSTNVDDDIRDFYDADPKGKPVLSHEGTEAYHKFLEYANDVLNTYEYHGTVFDNLKRVGAPNFIMFKKGIAVKMTEGVSPLQTDGYMELTDEIKQDMNKIFDEFYNEYKNN